MNPPARSIPAPEALPSKASTADLSVLLGQLARLGLDFAADALPTLLTRAVKEDLGPPAWREPWLRGARERREERRSRPARPRSG